MVLPELLAASRFASQLTGPLAAQPEQALLALYKTPALPQGTVAGSIPGDRLPDAGVSGVRG